MKTASPQALGEVYALAHYLGDRINAVKSGASTGGSI
jgi:hypothetical protein